MGIFSDVNNIDNIISQVKNLAKIRVDKINWDTKCYWVLLLIKIIPSVF